MGVVISQELSGHITGAFKDAGRAWLARLPQTVAEAARRYGLMVGAPLPGLSYSYVAPAIRADGSEVLLKVGVPNPELTSEAAALRCFDGDGAARLFEADPEQGVLVLERLRPGTPLSSEAEDAQATAIAAGILRRLWRPAPAHLPLRPLPRWVAGLARLRERYDGGTGPLAEPMVARAEALFAELLASSPQPMLLHGDLHYGNILAAEREPWLAIDPKGLHGEPTYDAAVTLVNLTGERLPADEAARIFRRRADQMVEMLGLDRQRLMRWALAHTVLSAWWSIEDEAPGGWETGFARSEVLQGLL